MDDARYFETVIIGSGFSGLLAAIRLQKKGCNNFVLMERNPELGGTWQSSTTTFSLVVGLCLFITDS